MDEEDEEEEEDVMEDEEDARVHKTVAKTPSAKASSAARQGARDKTEQARPSNTKAAYLTAEKEWKGWLKEFWSLRIRKSMTTRLIKRKLSCFLPRI